MEKAHLTAVEGPTIKIKFGGSPKIKVSFPGGDTIVLKRQEGPSIKLTTQPSALLKFGIGKNLTLFDTSFSNLTGSPEDNLTLLNYLNSLAVTWNSLINKPFNSLSNGFYVENGVLKLHGSGGAGSGSDSWTGMLSGVILWEIGLTYQSTKLTYKINGYDYQISPRRITLDPADPTLSRIDVFYVDSSSEIRILKGIPSVTPLKPSVGVGQIEYAFAIIAPGATQPTLACDTAVSYTHLRAHETRHDLVCRLLL